MDIDFLLEEEKRNIEQQVLTEFDSPLHSSLPRKEEKEGKEETTICDKSYVPNPEKKIEIEIKPVDPLKKKKADLIDDFLKLQEENGVIKIERKKLERMTKGVIIKEIANYMNEAMTSSLPRKEGEEEEKEQEQEQLTELNPNQLELVSIGLFQMNQVLISLLETGSHYAKDKTGGIAVLEGWANNSLKKREQFIAVFRLIYKDYKVQLDKYLSPVVQYAILMGNSAAEVIVTNVKKKKENSEQN